VTFIGSERACVFQHLSRAKILRVQLNSTQLNSGEGWGIRVIERVNAKGEQRSGLWLGGEAGGLDQPYPGGVQGVEELGALRADRGLGDSGNLLPQLFAAIPCWV